MDSWNYSTNFLVLKLKANSGYSIILERPWLAILIAFINCILGDMTSSYGKNSRIISLYPPAQPTFEYQFQIWIDELEFYEPNFFAVLSTITVKAHVEDLEEMPKLFEQDST